MISNTYPHWHMRGMIRDMLLYHSRHFNEPKVRVKQARNLLDFLNKSVTRENSPYSLLLKGELESFRRSNDSYLYHEHLEEVNEPLYFYQFIERVQAKGLQYLGEVDFRSMVPAGDKLRQALSKALVEQLPKLGRNGLLVG